MRYSLPLLLVAITGCTNLQALPPADACQAAIERARNDLAIARSRDIMKHRLLASSETLNDAIAEQANGDFALCQRYASTARTNLKLAGGRRSTPGLIHANPN